MIENGYVLSASDTAMILLLFGRMKSILSIPTASSSGIISDTNISRFISVKNVMLRLTSFLSRNNASFRRSLANKFRC